MTVPSDFYGNSIMWVIIDRPKHRAKSTLNILEATYLAAQM